MTEATRSAPRSKSGRRGRTAPARVGPEATPFRAVFDHIKPMIAAHAPPLTVLIDTPSRYLLEAGYSEKWRKQIWFGGVEIRRSYVTVHLIAIYMFPDLLDGVSPALRARQQGKSCFNFRMVDAALFGELKRLIRASMVRLRKAKLV